MANTKDYVGPTPNGGVKATIFYRDDNGDPADETVATNCEVVEYDATGNAIHETHADIRRD